MKTTMQSALCTSYDDVPYKSHPFSQSHPRRLETISSLFGMHPQHVQACRVLELGCASGENLLPMADEFIGSNFVGVDLSHVQIAAAQSTADHLQMTNVRLLHADLRALPADLGVFDYILAHGVFSWISQEAQQALFGICKHHLAPQGIAYISYNTFPGWHFRGMIRDMMQYRARTLAKPQDRIHQAKALLHFLAENVSARNNSYSLLLNDELETLNQLEDSYLFHEHLEEHNSPLYFHQFAEKADAAGLQYLGEAEFSTMFVEAFSPSVEATLRRVASTLIEAEQYMDFVRNRMFRQSLLCHKDVILDRSLEPTRIMPMSLASPTKPESQIVDFTTSEEVRFHCGASIATTSDPLTKTALSILGEQWPQYISFSQLLEAVQRRLQSKGTPWIANASTEQSLKLAKSLLSCYANGHADLSLTPPRFKVAVSFTPLASRLARYQATKQSTVTNQLHAEVQLRDYERQIIQLLDGQHDRQYLTTSLCSLIKAGVLRLTNEMGVVKDPQEIEHVIEQATTSALSRMANCALLIG